MTPDEQVEAIRKRMAELRAELTSDAQQVGRSAKAMASPTYYVRKFPWATLAVAAGIGFLIIPKKRKTAPPDMEALAELLKNSNMKAAISPEKPGIVKTLAVMGLSWAARAGMNYLLEQVTAMSKAETSPGAPQPSSPVDEPFNVEP